jgi:hypothetical protein
MSVKYLLVPDWDLRSNTSFLPSFLPSQCVLRSASKILLTFSLQPFPAIYRGALFPAGAGAQPVIVPVPLDYGLGTYMFLEDLCAYRVGWAGASHWGGYTRQARVADGGG